MGFVAGTGERGDPPFWGWCFCGGRPIRREPPQTPHKGVGSMISTLRKRLRNEEKGFTLIELLVVVIILGILTAIAVPSYLSFRGRAEDSANKSNVRSVIPSIESYYADNNTYSTMTLALLKTNYDQALDLSKYSLAN